MSWTKIIKWLWRILYIIFVVVISTIFLLYLFRKKLIITENPDWKNLDFQSWKSITWLFINNWTDTTGAVTEYWSWEEITWWVAIEAPDDPREYLEYIMSHWIWWDDYIVATPNNQPKMNSKTWDVNTQEMWNYIGNNKIKFEFDNKWKQWYIMFVTSKPISKAYKLFLWINWKTVWYIDENTKLPSYDWNEYLFELNHIKYYWGKTKSNNVNLSKSPIYINAVTSEAWNKVEKIIIFFK